MKQRPTTVTINGRVYDALSGRPIATTVSHTAKPQPVNHPTKSAPKSMDFAVNRRPSQAKIAPANVVHQTTQKSQTLRRESLAKPVKKHVEGSTRSPMISKFGNLHSKPQTATTAQPEVQKATVAQATVQKDVVETPKQPQVANQLSGRELKEHLIRERMAQIENKNRVHHKQKRKLFKLNSRLTSILTASLALLILAGYLTYLNLPNISMRVASSRAGISASLPSYKPDGYRLDGPITYSPGEVAISYRSDNNHGFSLTQKESNWDSQAVLDNYVLKQTSTYLTYQERGVTVYTFGNQAVWVNGGLLYTVNGDAELSSDQVLKLASSL